MSSTLYASPSHLRDVKPPKFSLKIALLLAGGLTMCNAHSNELESPVEESRAQVRDILSSTDDDTLVCEPEVIEEILDGGFCVEEKLNETLDIPHHVYINGQKIDIRDVKPFVKPIKQDSRVLNFPISDEGIDLIVNLNKNESLEFAEKDNEEYKTSSGKRPRLRFTAVRSYELIKKYAAMEGYGVAIFSGYRTKEEGDALYKKASKADRGKMISKGIHSGHITGGTMDLVLYKIENGEVKLLTPDFEHQDRGTVEDILRLKMFASLAGLANLSNEPWHYEIGTKQSNALLSSYPHSVHITDQQVYPAIT